jgi:hypothetical protein
MKNQDGGPAFPTMPVKVKDYNGVGIVVQGTPGMSLRDWFAGMAMQGMMTRWQQDEFFRFSKEDARRAYWFAEYMIAERNKGGEE